MSPDDPIKVPTRQEAEERARRQYQSVLGKTILVEWVLGYDKDGAVHDIQAPTGRPFRVKVKQTRPEDVLRWSEPDRLEAYWEVDVEPHPSWPLDLEAPYVDGLPGFVVAPEEAPAGTRGRHPALDAINRHRRSIGQAPLDPQAAGWTAEDVEAEAQRISRLNPAMAKLKRKLMR